VRSVTSKTVGASISSAPPARRGYYGGWRDGTSAGVYRGVGPIVETDRYPSSAAGGKTGLLSLPEEKRLGPTEFPCFLTGPDGESGMVHFEHHVFGLYGPYGF